MKRLWYRNSASNWNEALPLGNGRLGAMIYGGTRLNVYAMNDDSLWYGGQQDRINPDALKALPEIRRLLREEKMEKAREMAENCLTGTTDGQRHYEPLCNLFIQNLDGLEPRVKYYDVNSFAKKDMHQLDAPVTEYRRELELDNALHTLRFSEGEKQVFQESFISFPDGVMAVKLYGFPTRVFMRRGAYSSENRLYGENTLCLRGTAGDDGVSYCALVRAVGDGVAAAGSALLCPEDCVLYFVSETSFRCEDPLKEALRRLDAAEKAGYEALKARHTADFSEIMERCSLTLGEEEDLPTDELLQAYEANPKAHKGLISTYFAFGRYLLASCSRPGSLPANLQGIWNADFLPPWDSKYTININAQMNYWPAEKLNLSEMHLPLFEHLKRMLPRGREVAEKMYGARGFVAHHNTDIWGDCAPQGCYLPATYWPLGAAWLCLHIMEHYRYTRDDAFLKEYYPILREAALFFTDTLVPVGDGYLGVSPSCSPENTFETQAGERGTLTDRAAMDAQILTQLFRDVIEAGGILKEETKEFEAVLPRLHPVEIRDGRVAEWYADYKETEPGHRHISHLFALYPASEILPGDAELFKAAENTLNFRLSHGGGHTGWSRAWIICMWARLLKGDKAGENVELLLTRSTLKNLFDHHPPFQIDGNFGSIAGIAEMLVQCHEGFVRLYPAVPSDWTEGELRGVKLYHGFTADLKWKDGRGEAVFTAGQDAILKLEGGETIPMKAGETVQKTVRF